MSLNNSLCKSERVIFSVRQLQGGLDFLCEGVTEHIGGACLKYLFLTRSHLGITGFLVGRCAYTFWHSSVSGTGGGGGVEDREEGGGAPGRPVFWLSWETRDSTACTNCTLRLRSSRLLSW